MATFMDSQLRQVQIVWIALFVAGIVYVALPEFIAVQPREISPILYPILAVQSVVILAVVVFLRKMLIGRAVEVLATDANNRAAILKWRSGEIATAALCESIVLLGLVVRFVGGTRVQSALLYLLGLGAMIVFWPKRPQ